MKQTRCSLLTTAAGACVLAGAALAAPRADEPAESKPVRWSGTSWHTLDAARQRAVPTPRRKARPVFYLRMLGELAGKT